MTSPIAKIIERVPDSLINIAPEREVETRELLNGVRLELNDDPDFAFFGAPAEARSDDHAGTIGVPARGIELLWVMGYALWGRYQDYRSQQGSGESTGSLASSVPLLRWALENQGTTSPKPWPDELPKPTGFEHSNGEPSAERIADELAMCAAGWLLHHELTHVVRGDSPHVAPSVSRDQERNADWTATKWLLDGSPDGVALEKRALGIATAILCLVALELAHKVKSGPQRPYPSATDRLIRCLGHPRLSEGLSADLLTAIGLRLLIDLFEIDVPAGEFETSAECIESYGSAIQRSLDSIGIVSETG